MMKANDVLNLQRYHKCKVLSERKRRCTRVYDTTDNSKVTKMGSQSRCAIVNDRANASIMRRERERNDEDESYYRFRKSDVK